MSAEVITSPAIHDTVRQLLAPLLAPASVTLKVPDAIPANGHVLVRLAGGRGRFDTVLQAAQIIIEARHSDPEEAWNLIAAADANLHALRYEQNAIRNVTTFGGPADLPDPVVGLPRYTATYEVTVRASA